MNEVENIDLLVNAILSQRNEHLDIEVLVADGGSTDGTVAHVIALAERLPVRLVQNSGTKGLAGDVLAAARDASSPIIVVMDADFSHPPDAIASLVGPIHEQAADMVIGSRYIPGGSTPDWPLRRKVLSRLGGLVAWPMTDVRDPMSGFFAIRKASLLAVDPNAAGFKIGLEAMAAGGDSLRVTEVPITFRDRERGESKISPFQIAAYARRVMVLAGGAVSLDTAAKFAAVGALGLCADVAISGCLLAVGATLFAAQVASFVIATVLNYVLNSRWSFAGTAGAGNATDWARYRRFLLVSLLALFLRGGIVSTAVENWGSSAQTAILLGVAVAAAVNYIGSAFYIFPSTYAAVSQTIRWRVAAVGVFLYVVLLRLSFMGTMNLLPEEAYYWNYSQHLDLGYLDHPPMVAWLITLGTQIFGKSEFAVRIFAGACWLIAAMFTFNLTRNLYGKTAAFVSLLLVSALPFFFVTGMVMMPDAPLIAMWAGSLYFLERALIASTPTAWLGVSVCVGLGFLSKYTILLLAPATLLFVLLDPPSQHWLRRREPYIAAILALIIALPVFIWNSQNHWASFAFQSTRRLDGAYRFSMFEMLGSMLLLLTPVGIAAAFAVISPWRSGRTEPALVDLSDRRLTFAAVYTLLPLAVFVAFSTFHQIKLNWTGPVWLALLPVIAHKITAQTRDDQKLATFVQRAWGPVIAVSLLFFGALLNFIVYGLPGTAALSVVDLRSLPTAWKPFGAEAHKIQAMVERETGKVPLMVGMDRYFISSEIAFYSGDKDSVKNTAGRSMFGEESLMYGYWFNPADQANRDMIMFGLKEEQVSNSRLEGKFAKLGPVQQKTLYRDAKEIGRFYYRIGYKYIAH